MTSRSVAAGSRRPPSSVTLAEVPESATVEPGLLTAEIFPELPADIYARHTDPKLLTMNYWFREGVHWQLGNRTHGGGAALLRARRVGESGRRALLVEAATPSATPGPEFVCASGAFMDLAPSRPGRFETMTAICAGLDARSGLANASGSIADEPWGHLRRTLRQRTNQNMTCSGAAGELRPDGRPITRPRPGGDRPHGRDRHDQLV